MVSLTEEDFGTLLVCSIRYCQGRQTYMPTSVQDIGRKHLKELSDKDLGVLLNDCKTQDEFGIYGDIEIDKPGWLVWRANLENEKAVREQENYKKSKQKKEGIKEKARHYLELEYKKGCNADEDLIDLLNKVLEG
jgi:hypothetical protein